jgi:hypothetical protein
MSTTPSKPQLCVSCVHYQFDKGMVDSLADPCRCIHPAVRDALGTDSVPASWARGDRRADTRKRCGPGADFFEPALPKQPVWVTLVVAIIIAAAAAAIIGVWP